MELVVDLHIHSHYSRATSKQMNTEDLYKWGKIKGINIIGTGDFTHPDYFAELREKLEPAEPGLFTLKPQYANAHDAELPDSVRNNLIRFVLTVEISNIYKRHDKVRKVHNLIIVPDFETAAEINHQLSKIGNIKSDGRPILGMDSKDLLQITLDSHPDSLFVPAHIWTPWFSIFGSKSGFDTLEEAFGELADKIVAIETGLSSDPYMNWRIKELQGKTIISNSDAHSPQKLGREANVINANLSYQDIIGAVRTNDERFVGTIEFYPEEGKYHNDGHRICNISFSPQETKKHNGICPVCSKPLIIGVQNRVDSLANLPVNSHSKNGDYKTSKTIEYIVPLCEMIAEMKGVKSSNAASVIKGYEKLYSKFGDEFSMLRKIPVNEFKENGFEEIGEAIERMRKGEVFVTPGYDGVFGVIKVFASSGEKSKVAGQTAMF
jgi:DNA helicase-2/ATP-dependent DNA helicase PcrA